MNEIVAPPLDIPDDAALPDIWNSHHSKVATDGDELAPLHGQEGWYDRIHVGLCFCRGEEDTLVLPAVVLGEFSLVFLWDQVTAMH